VLQGLTYRDWYLVVYDKRRTEAIYARWRRFTPSVPEYDA
jgi:hypothetical protein